jgi:hypothetical protein
VSYNKLRAAIEAAHDPDAREVVFAGADAQKIIDWVNARPPITDIHLDHIITVIHKDPTGDWVGIAFVKEGCVFHTGQVPLEDYTAMLTTVFGAGS